MSLIETEASLLTRLEPLQQVGLTTRALPNASNQTGKIQGNGVITLAWEFDQGLVATDPALSFQTVEVNWIIDGRILNLRDQTGLLVIRDDLYNRIIGFKPDHATSPISAKTFRFMERTEIYWRFEFRFSHMGIVQAICPPPDGTLDPSVNLVESVFDVDGANLTDEWGIKGGDRCDTGEIYTPASGIVPDVP